MVTMRKFFFTILIAAILYLLVIGAFIIVLIAIPILIAVALYRKFIYKKQFTNNSNDNHYNSDIHKDNNQNSKRTSKNKVIEADYTEIKK